MRRLQFQPCGDIHPVAEDIVALDHDIAEVHANPELDRRPLARGVELGHRGLNRHGAFDGIDGAAEFHQRPVAHHLDDPAAVPPTAGLNRSAQTPRSADSVPASSAPIIRE